MTALVPPRVDPLAAVDLVSEPDLTGARASVLFASPASAITTLTAEFRAVWDLRSDDWEERRTGTLELASGAYVQWIGYGHAVVAEVSSNTYLREQNRLSEAEEQRVLSYGFSPPGEESPNFWAEMDRADGAERLAVAVVSVLTAVFGAYVG